MSGPAAGIFREKDVTEATQQLSAILECDLPSDKQMMDCLKSVVGETLLFSRTIIFLFRLILLYSNCLAFSVWWLSQFNGSQYITRTLAGLFCLIATM